MTIDSTQTDNNGGVPAHIHIVEDDRLIAATMVQGLSNAGYKTSSSESAEKCLVNVENDRPDLAVIDMRLPGKSGLDLARVLGTDFGIPFMFLTAYADAELVEEAVSAGGLAYLVKPVDNSQLIPGIESALARSREIKALQIAHDNITTALERGREVSVAVGLLMERHHIDRETAFNELRQNARSQRKQLGEIAIKMLDSSETLNLHRQKNAL